MLIEWKNLFSFLIKAEFCGASFQEADTPLPLALRAVDVLFQETSSAGKRRL
jgi:hypothetical protein